MDAIIETKCPNCTRELSAGEGVYLCRDCRNECCTACSENGVLFDVLCDECQP